MKKEKIYNQRGEYIGERDIGYSYYSTTGKTDKEMEKYKFSISKKITFPCHIPKPIIY